MRLTNNILVNMQLDRMNLIDSKGNAAVADKLMGMLKAAPNQQLSMAAVLQSINEGVGKFLINGLGQLDLAVDSQLQTTEQSRANITFSLNEGKLTATIDFNESQKVEPQTAKLETGVDLAKALKQLGLPPTEQNTKALSLLTEYHIEPSAERVKQLAEGSFLASKTNEFASDEAFTKVLLSKDQQVDWSKSLKAVVVDWLSQGGSEKTQAPARTVEQLMAAPLSEEAQANKPQVKTSAAQTESKGIPAMQQAQSDEINLSSTIDNVKQMLQKLNPKALVPLVSSNLELNIENLHRSNQIFNGTHTIGQMKQLLIDKMANIFRTLEPSAALEQEIVKWLESDTTEFALSKQLESLEGLIGKHNPEAAEQLRESFEQVSRATNLLEQVTNQMLAMHLPIQLGDHETQIEMYVNKRRSKSKGEDFRMLLALDTNTLGQVQVLVTDQVQLVEIQFRLMDESIKEAFEAAQSDFEELISAFDVKKVKISFGCHFNEPAVLEAMKALSPETVSSIDVRV